MAYGITLNARQAYIARKVLDEAVAGSMLEWGRIRAAVTGYNGPRAGIVTGREVDETVRLLMLADPADDEGAA